MPTIDPVYTASSSNDAGLPGEFPFTRGIHPEMYRQRLWTMRQYAGFGTAIETNARFKQLLEAGQTGLSVAFDLPTQMGLDSDHELADGEIGRAGVAIDTVDDLAVVFDGIPLDRVSTSMTINATAAILLAMYLVVADERGIGWAKVRGTIQNDILKEYVARGTYIFPPAPSLRLTADVFAFVAEHDLPFNPISVSGYHMREAGATAVQEVAFTLSNAMEYLDQAKRRGLDVNRIAPRLSFFFAAHNDLFEEVAKFRAARQLWATLMRNRYEADDKSCRLRFHTQTGGSTLTAQQPLNNVVRVAVQALAAILGGTQSLHTNGYDEALSLPTEEAAHLALRTQQVLAHESGVAATADPLGGSFYVESLTESIAEHAQALVNDVESRGGAAAAIAEGFVQEQIARSAYQQQRDLEGQESIVVGVNQFVVEETPRPMAHPDYRALGEGQKNNLHRAKLARDAIQLKAALDNLRTVVANPHGALMPAIINAVRARGTIGEISDVMRAVWGAYRPG